MAALLQKHWKTCLWLCWTFKLGKLIMEDPGWPRNRKKEKKKNPAMHEYFTCDPKLSVSVPYNPMKVIIFFGSVEVISSLFPAVFKSQFRSYYLLCSASWLPHSVLTTWSDVSVYIYFIIQQTTWISDSDEKHDCPAALWLSEGPMSSKTSGMQRWPWLLNSSMSHAASTRAGWLCLWEEWLCFEIYCNFWKTVESAQIQAL